MSKVVNTFDKNYKFTYSLDKVLKMLVYTRILYPGSKLNNVDNQSKLLGDWNIDYNHVIRSLDKLPILASDIQMQMHKSISNTIGRTATLVFYDVTNYYFTNDFNDDDIIDEEGNIIHKSLRKRRPSKEKRLNPIVQIGMFMDDNGIPITYKLFPGNNTDPVTYIPAIEQVKKQFGLERIVTVADKAMNSAKIVEALRECNAVKLPKDIY